MNERIDTAYFLITALFTVAGYLIWGWCRHVARDKRRLSGRQRY